MVTSTQNSERLMSWMTSLSDATRLRLLRLVEQQELGVVELCDVLQLPQSTVSRHLKILGDDNWVRGRQQATTRRYRIDELEPSARKLWQLAREQTENWPTVKQDQLRLERRLADRDVDSKAFFAGAAGEWDRLRRELYGDRFSVAAMLALLPRETIVADLGCGSGNLAIELAPNVKRVIGVDNSAAMLKAAKRRTKLLGNVELLRGELEALPIDAKACNAALLVLALTYVPEPAIVLGEMARILKVGGRGVIVDLLPHDRDDFRRQLGQVRLGLEPRALTKIMTDAGFVNVSTRLLSPAPNVKGPALFLASGTKK